MRRLLPLALLTLASAPAAHAAPKAHISMVSTTTGAVTTIRSAPNPQVFYAGPVWSADGRSVFVLREKYRYEGVDVLQVSAASGAVTALDRFKGAEYAELSPTADHVAYSTDPTDDDGTSETVRIAPVGTGAGLAQVLPNHDRVSDLSYSPDGRLLAVGHHNHASGDSFITVYDTATLTEQGTVQTEIAVFDDDSWLPDSSALIYRSFGESDRTLNRLDLATGQLSTIATSPFDDIDGHAVSSTGRSALVARRSVSIHPDGATFRVPRNNHFGGGIDFSPDAGSLAYAYTRNGRELGAARVNVRDVATGALEQSVSAGDGEPIGLSYSPTGRRVVVTVALRQVNY